MVINCEKCDRPLAAINPPTLDAPMVAILKRSLTGFLGVDPADLGPVMELLVKPTPEMVTKTFNARCPNGC